MISDVFWLWVLGVAAGWFGCCRMMGRGSFIPWAVALCFFFLSSRSFAQTSVFVAPPIVSGSLDTVMPDGAARPRAGNFIDVYDDEWTTSIGGGGAGLYGLGPSYRTTSFSAVLEDFGDAWIAAFPVYHVTGSFAGVTPFAGNITEMRMCVITVTDDRALGTRTVTVSVGTVATGGADGLAGDPDGVSVSLPVAQYSASTPLPATNVGSMNDYTWGTNLAANVTCYGAHVELPAMPTWTGGGLGGSTRPSGTTYPSTQPGVVNPTTQPISWMQDTAAALIQDQDGNSIFDRLKAVGPSVPSGLSDGVHIPTVSEVGSDPTSAVLGAITDLGIAADPTTTGGGGGAYDFQTPMNAFIGGWGGMANTLHIAVVQWNQFKSSYPTLIGILKVCGTGLFAWRTMLCLLDGLFWSLGIMDRTWLSWLSLDGLTGGSYADEGVDEEPEIEEPEPAMG